MRRKERRGLVATALQRRFHDLAVFERHVAAGGGILACQRRQAVALRFDIELVGNIDQAARPAADDKGAVEILVPRFERDQLVIANSA